MRLQYRFERIPELADVELMVENQGDKLVYELSGPGSDKCKRILKHFFGWFNRCGPISCHEGANVYTHYFPPMPSLPHARMLEGFIYNNLFRNPMPRVATIEVTANCQCNCVHCSAHRPSDKRPVLSRATIESVVAQVLDMGAHGISYTGGEPLMRPDLEDLIAMVPQDKATVTIFSNAVALTPERAASLKAAGLYSIMISLDSPDPEEHDRLRNRRGTFEAVKRGAQAAVEAGLVVNLSTYATPEYVREGKLNRVAELAAQWGVHEISVFNAVATGRYLKACEVMVSDEDRNAILEAAENLHKLYGRRPRIITKAWTNRGKGFSRYIGCMSGHYQFHVTAQGDLTPCDLTPLSFGNVNNETIADIWARLSSHSAYSERWNDCRMMSPDFREKYIDPIPEGASLPYPIDELDAACECSGSDEEALGFSERRVAQA
jgi:MoaA/NifB/PqqE/SkfB family radical SAM enzyme